MRTLDFTNEPIYIGVDVHKKSWNVSIMLNGITHKTFTQPPKPDILSNYLNKNFPGGNYICAYEAGFCGFWIQHDLEKKGVKCIVINPADVPTKHKEKNNKTDKVDSRKIARSLQNNELEPIYVPSRQSLEDRSLIRFRYNITTDLTRCKNRIKSILNFYGIEIPRELDKRSQKYFSWLDNVELHHESGTDTLKLLLQEYLNLRKIQLDTTTKIRHLSKIDKYSKNIKWLTSIPGIGIITAMIILTEIDSISRFSNLDKLCSFIGLVPIVHSSGDKEIIGGITRRGNTHLKKCLVESAWMAIRSDIALMMNFKDYCKRMEPNKAIIKITRKLVNRIRFVLKNKTEYKKKIL
jgi:transposase